MNEKNTVTTREDRTARISNLYHQLQQQRLAYIRADLAKVGFKDASSITAHYELSEQYGWPVLTKLEADGVEVEEFMGSDAQDQLNALLINDYDPDQGDTSIKFSLLDLPASLE